MATVEKLPYSKMVLFALGQFGWSLCSFGVGNLMNYFYMPPESGAVAAFPSFFHQGAVLGFLTVLGVLTAVGRVFDAVTNPLIANWSDRSTARLGRRTSFMAFAALPFAVLSFLLFFPVVPGQSGWNVLWLAVVVLLFYFFFVAYTTPYTTLVSEYGHTPEERLTLSTFISVTWALGFAVGQGVFAFQPMLESALSLTPTRAFQGVMLLFAVVSLGCMLLPVLFVQERRYAEPHVSKESVREALRSTFRNRSFLVFALSDFMYWIALTFIQMGMVYYVTTLLRPKGELREDTAFVTTLMTVLFLSSFVFYAPINILARRFGKKRLMVVGFFLFALTFVAVTLMGLLPVPRVPYAFALAVLASMPVAIFGILPIAVISDIAEADGRRTGSYKAGIFFGTRTFMMNLGISVANFLFPSFLLLGKDVANPLGVRLSSVAAFLFCAVGLGLLLRYDEQAVLRDMQQGAQPGESASKAPRAA